jgi:hypothetical protein
MNGDYWSIVDTYRHKIKAQENGPLAADGHGPPEGTLLRVTENLGRTSAGRVRRWKL